jgi:hypothetical protein
MINTIRWLWAEVVHAWATAGYWIRPYDMLADRRRWFWQPRTRCSGVIVLPEDHPLLRETP